jgi:multidrug efflux pump subunit AcrA (membrane-fusion protein)
MKRHIQIWGTRAVLVAVIFFASQRWGLPLYKQYFTPKKTVIFVPTTTVRQGDLLVSFQEVGSLRAERSASVISEISGRIISIAPEGTAIKPGDMLVELDTTDIDRDVRDKELAFENVLTDVTRARAELEMLKEANATELAKAQAQADFDLAELQRAKTESEKKKRLADEKLIPRAEAEQAELSVKAKELAVKKGDLDLKLKIKENQSLEKRKEREVAKVVFASNLAKSALEEMQGRRNKATIIAPAAGMLVVGTFYRDGVQKYKIGDMIERRQQVCELPDLTSMQVKVNVGEADAPKVRVDQQVLVRLDAVPDRLFHGKVMSISPLATEGRWWESGSTPGRKNFDVLVDLKESDPKKVKPGMTANVEFISDTVKNAMYVPLECVHERDGKTFCFVKQGSRYSRQPVEVGKRNDNFIVVKNGLARTDMVALRDPSKAAEASETGAPGEEVDATKGKAHVAPVPENGKKN